MDRFIFCFILGIAMFLAGCGNSARNGNNQNASEAQTLPDMHNARIALDFTGTYRGVVPCADCEGIQTTLILAAEEKYQLQTVYLGKSEQVFEETGTYRWNEAGNTITLEGIENAPNQYFVGENMVFQLDMEGNRITGELAEMYILRKTE